jgi:hypothetical protein
LGWSQELEGPLWLIVISLATKNPIELMILIYVNLSSFMRRSKMIRKGEYEYAQRKEISKQHNFCLKIF